MIVTKIEATTIIHTTKLNDKCLMKSWKLIEFLQSIVHWFTGSFIKNYWSIINLCYSYPDVDVTFISGHDIRRLQKANGERSCAACTGECRWRNEFCRGGIIHSKPLDDCRRIVPPAKGGAIVEIHGVGTTLGNPIIIRIKAQRIHISINFQYISIIDDDNQISYCCSKII